MSLSESLIKKLKLCNQFSIDVQKLIIEESLLKLGQQDHKVRVILNSANLKDLQDITCFILSIVKI